MINLHTKFRMPSFTCSKEPINSNKGHMTMTMPIWWWTVAQRLGLSIINLRTK